MARDRDGARTGRRSVFGRWRRVVCGAALLAGLGMSSTAVLAYADLLPIPFQLGFPDETVVGVAALPHVAHQLARREPLRIVAFGSSSTQGVGATTPANTYPARLEVALRQSMPQNAGITVLNRGVGGEAVDDMLRRIERDVIALNPQLVIWQTGSNDPLRGVSLDHFREATVTAVQRILEAGIDVVLMEPQWCPRLDATPGAYRFRDAVRDIGADLAIPVIRRSELMQGWIAQGKLSPRELFAPDGLHMADRGYDLLARAAAEDVLRGAGAVSASDRTELATVE